MNNLIKTHFLNNFNIQEYDVVESTMDIARTLNDRSCAFTKEQTKGRGKNDRKWEAKRGNLFLSICIKPQRQSINEVAQLSFVTSVALANVLKRISDDNKLNLNINCKWPNDVLIDGKKIAGILLESEIKNGVGTPLTTIIGIGVNVLFSPENVMYPTTNLLNEGIKIDATELMKKLVEEFDVLYYNWLNQKFSNIRNLWLNYAYKLGKEISVKTTNITTNGIFENLDEDGTLIIRKDNGEVIEILSGDVF